MIAVVKVGGHQALVRAGDTIRIDRIPDDVGSILSLPTLLISQPDGESFSVGTPLLEGVAVKAKVLEHDRDDKIRVFKMKKRKRYRRNLGHRQDYSVIEITDIPGASAKSAKKETAEKPAKKEDDTTEKKASEPKKTAEKKDTKQKVEKADKDA